MTYNSSSAVNRLSRYWLLIGVAALAVAGLYSLTLVIGRAPMLSNNAEIQRIFHSALVVHVDLSVLVWFLSIACMFWSMATAGSRNILPYVEEAALLCFALAVFCMMVSPFDPQAAALMSNYIPVISSPIFLLALGFLLCGVLLMLGKQLAGVGWQRVESSAAAISLISIACFFWSYHLMPGVFEGEQYFDMLFWGGGHVLQLTHTQFLMAVWLLLIASLRGDTGSTAIQPKRAGAICSNKWVDYLLIFNLLLALVSPLAYFIYDITGSEFRQFFTRGIMTLGGIAPGILAICMVRWLWQSRGGRKGKQAAFWSCALVSVCLYLYGGFLALLIEGQNVMIPAHYHGSIVGVTLAFMGFAYAMLPRFGYRDVSGWRVSYWQPIIYGLGQVMHVSGLAYSGGYGVLRKTVGGTDALALNIKIALGVMGFGGLLAIIGGLLFVLVVVRSIYAPRA